MADSLGIPAGFDPAIWAKVSGKAQAPAQTAAPQTAPAGFDPDLWNQVVSKNKPEPVAADKQAAGDTAMQQMVDEANKPLKSYFAAAQQRLNPLYQAKGPWEAAAMGVNNAFEQFGREIKDKFLGLTGQDEERQNLKTLYDSYANQQLKNEQNFPVAATAGNIVGDVAKYAPAIAAAPGAGILGQAAMGAGAGALEDMQQKPIQSALLGAGGGAAGAVVGQGLGTLLNKTGNAIAGVMSDTGEKFANIAKQTGQKASVIDYMPGWVKKTFDVTGDMPFGGTADTIRMRYKGIAGNIDDLLSNSMDDVSKQKYNKSMTDLLNTIADPMDVENHAAFDLAQKIATDKEWTAIVANSGNLKKYWAQDAYDKAKNNIIQRADHYGTIDTSSILKNIDDSLSNVQLDKNQLELGVSKGLLDSLNTVKASLQNKAPEGNISFSDLESVLSKMQGIVSDAYKATSSATSGDKAILQSVKKGMEELQFASLKNVDKSLWQDLRTLKTTSRVELAKYKAANLAGVFENANPNDAVDMMMNTIVNSKDAAQTLWNNLEERGRNAVKAGYLDNLFGKIKGTGDIDLDQIKNFSSAPLMKVLQKNDDFVNQFFAPQEKQQIVGAIKALDYMDSYKNILSRSPTGRMQVDMTKLLAGAGAAGAALATGTGGAAAGAAGASLGASTLFNRLMNKSAGPWLAAASTLKKGSPEYLSTMEHIMKMAAVSAGGEAGSIKQD